MNNFNFERVIMKNMLFIFLLPVSIYAGDLMNDFKELAEVTLEPVETIKLKAENLLTENSSIESTYQRNITPTESFKTKNKPKKEKFCDSVKSKDVTKNATDEAYISLLKELEQLKKEYEELKFEMDQKGNAEKQSTETLIKKIPVNKIKTKKREKRYVAGYCIVETYCSCVYI